MSPVELNPDLDFFNRLSDGVVVYDLTGCFVFLNPRAAEIFGGMSEALVGQKGWEACPDAISAAFYQACQRAIAQQVPVQLQEFSVRLQTWFEVRIYPASERLIVSFQDISQYKQNEAVLQEACDDLEHRLIRQAVRLRQTQASLFSESLQRQQAQTIADQSNARLARVLESIMDGFCALDKHWRFSYVNQRAEGLFQRSQNELLGQSIWKVFPHSIGTQFYRACHQALDTGTSVRVEEFAEAIDRWLEYHIYPSPDGISIYFQDITDRKQAEADRQRLYQQAQEANRLKHEFLLTVSHELRTPLNAILGWAHLLKQTELQPAMVHRGIEIIDRKAKDLKQIIYDLLDISQITAGRMRLRADSVDITELVQDAIRSLDLAAEIKMLRVETQIQTKTALQVIGDARRLRHVMWHLLSNAIKFTPDQGNVTVKLFQQSRWVCIEISDTGKGIPREFLPYVFEDFRQADSSTTRSFGGLGLGLAIVRYLIELHGGTIAIDSAGEDQGTTATIQLPIAP